MSSCDQCIVRQFNALKSLSKEELVRVSNCKTSKTIKKGETIFEEGEMINGIYCIKEGICKLSKLSPNGRDQIVKLVVKGDLLGQRSLIGNESANLSAVALNDMEVCFIPKREVVDDLSKNPDFCHSMLEQMANDLRDSDNIIVNMAQKSVKNRIAEILIYMFENFGENEKGFLSIHFSRDDYANLVGTATESAIRILSQFKKDGLIATEGKHIKIVDMEALKKVE
ncbi:Crp/Fnr family transcriptional regulator [Oceanihabitans sp. 2_MG-2023]|uniref:Crp/Fnr family transcriptional regulator n=1 Tax=Oceanihabitans sp. 2_MG-2023 TaxID=3062661 RepID=UPI0026E383F4|nr:Crp/Fnr family transcriptional regulator [Oceanihabitans sp. 2_MG-2023]MDO6597066.1 Crp/Fnr family transcriptional regulator [Oceanihabitans sp. 2_MG-2023]